MAKQKKAVRNFGTVERLRSGRYRAKFTHPITGERISAPVTYTDKASARVWLSAQQTDLERGTWQDYRQLTPVLNDYARRVIMNKPKPKTVEGDLQSWNTHIAPHLGSVRVADLTTSQVNTWHRQLKLKGVGNRALSKAYGVLRNVMNHAVNEELRQANPCKIKGAGTNQSPERPHLNPEQVNALADNIEPRYKALVLVLAYCLLRKGEATALRRCDLHKDLKTGEWSLTVSRKVQDKPGGGWRYGSPKTKAGIRTIPIPTFLIPILEQHLHTYVEPGNDSLVFTSSTGAPAYNSGSDAIKKALRKIGLDRIKGIAVHTHDLRHTGATWLAQAGATTSELQKYLGDSSPHMAMRYTHAAENKTHLATRLNDLYQGTGS